MTRLAALEGNPSIMAYYLPAFGQREAVRLTQLNVPAKSRWRLGCILKVRPARPAGFAACTKLEVWGTGANISAALCCPLGDIIETEHR